MGLVVVFAGKTATKGGQEECNNNYNNSINQGESGCSGDQ